MSHARPTTLSAAAKWIHQTIEEAAAAITTGVEKDVDVGNFGFVRGFLNGVKLNFIFADSLTGPLDRRWVVAPSRRRDHQPKQHLQRARRRQYGRHRSPAGGSRSVAVGDDLQDVSTPFCHHSSGTGVEWWTT